MFGREFLIDYFGHAKEMKANEVMDAMESRINELEQKLEIAIDNAVKYCGLINELEEEVKVLKETAPCYGEM